MAKAAKAEFKPPVSEEAVREKTGKGWDEWLDILDQAGGVKMTHGEIVAVFEKKYSKDVGPWWQQMITVGYERARGLRQVNQGRGGDFSVSATKIVNVALDTLYDSWADGRRRVKWLAEPKASVRSSSKGKSMNIDFGDDTVVKVFFESKGDQKTQVAVEHSKLPDAKAAELRKTYWRERLERLKESLEG